MFATYVGDYVRQDGYAPSEVIQVTEDEVYLANGHVIGHGGITLDTILLASEVLS